MNIFTKDETDFVKGCITDLLAIAPKGMTPFQFFQALKGRYSELLIGAAIFELADEGAIMMSTKSRSNKNGDSERIWYLPKDRPKPKCEATKHREPKAFGICPKCGGGKFEKLDGGGAKCQDCDLEQKGLFS